MTTISIPINDSLNDFIDEQVRLGNSSSKADLIRRAIIRYKEEIFIQSIMEAREDVRKGRVFTGDLDKLAEGFE
jgi:Arc/MetJ-type ribon-helix-helix transcriptional regulator